MMMSIARPPASTGIGLTLLPVFYAHGGFGGAARHAGQRRFITRYSSPLRASSRSARRIARLDGAIVGVAPHSLRAVTPDELQQPRARAQRSDAHARRRAGARSRRLRRVVGQRPVEWLLDHAAVDRRWCLVHATHMTRRETLRLAASGAVAGLCPITEANLGDGHFPRAGLPARRRTLRHWHRLERAYRRG
jgi:cytosine/adenosine deaminase-related metal-dependent hydrolase